MKIDCLSDLHGHYPDLQGGDLLIIAGDLTARNDEEGYQEFLRWLPWENYKEVIVIAGNHDNKLQKYQHYISRDAVPLKYLQDSGTDFEGLKIWGSPWTLTFPGMNPKCKAFTVDSDAQLALKWMLIPEDVDILITHMPIYMMFDEVEENRFVGSYRLRSLIVRNYFPNLKLHVCGHIHEHGGKVWQNESTKFVNASHVDENYCPRDPGYVSVTL